MSGGFVGLWGPEGHRLMALTSQATLTIALYLTQSIAVPIVLAIA